MRKSHIIILVILIALLGVFFYFFDKPGAKTDNVAQNGSQNPVLDIAPLVTEHASSTYAEMQIIAPKSDSGHLPEIFALIQDAKNDFWGRYGNLTAKQAKDMYIRDNNQYQMYADTKIATSSKTVSYIIQIYQYTGGAHGGTSVNTFTYDKTGTLVTADDVFQPGYLSVIAPMSKKYFYDTFGEYAQPQMIDAGTEATTTNYSSWYLTDDSVVFIFGQYQVGPYALGIQEYPIAKSAIQAILKPAFR